MEDENQSIRWARRAIVYAGLASLAASQQTVPDQAFQAVHLIASTKADDEKKLLSAMFDFNSAIAKGGMDVGWNSTVAIWGARNPASNVTYLYAEYCGHQEAPAVHAAAIKSKGAWIPGTIDPAAGSRNQMDGKKLLEMYRTLGLQLTPADNAVTTGIQTCWEALVEGSLKVMPSCENWLREFRKYHRDEKGKIVKANDHLMDATRYLMVSGRRLMRIQPQPKRRGPVYPTYDGPNAWMI